MEVEAVGTDEQGRAWIKPRGRSDLYVFVYRAATEVYWDETKLRFIAPLEAHRVGHWPQWRWLKDIVLATKELGVTLSFSTETSWQSIDDEQRQLFEQEFKL